MDTTCIEIYKNAGMVINMLLAYIIISEKKTTADRKG